MNSRAQIRLMPDGRRLHLNDGPIDLIVEGFGALPEIEAAYRAASARFATVLDELCSELAFLRQPCTAESEWPGVAIARRMVAAVMPYASEYFITPMAAVAGAVAEEILSTMVQAANLDRAYVNNGGDIAVHLNRDQSFTVGMVERPDRPSLLGTATIKAADPVRGIATSGWRGRSFSLGIADAVTVLADRAAAADAAATIIANAVDLPGHPAVVRVPARELAPDSDLGNRLVTQAVGPLNSREKADAFDAGMKVAGTLRRMGLIRSAAISLQGLTLIIRDVDPERIAQQKELERTLMHA
jgi:ApbE superfamily uncharacterized protein (UPF0280 family)